MIEIIKYVADDGTEFDDEYDCREYEWQQSFDRTIQFVLLDGRRRRLDPIETSSYEDVWFIFIPNETAYHQLRRAWDGNWIDACSPNFLWDNIPKFGLWAYDEGINRDDGWYHVGDYIQSFQTMADEVMAVINGV